MWRRLPRPGEGGQEVMLSVDFMSYIEGVKVEDASSVDESGVTLVIPLAKDEHAGQYTCSTGTQPPKVIKHTVLIRGEKKSVIPLTWGGGSKKMEELEQQPQPVFHHCSFYCVGRDEENISGAQEPA